MTEEKFISQCSDCGGQIIFSAEKRLARCPYCGAPNAMPKKREQNRNLKYANELRNGGNFTDAAQAYLSVLEESPNEVEARWGRLLSKYGVIYVEDKEKQECHITCRRSVRSSFQNEHDYLEILKLAEPEIREKYEKDAAYIDRVQARIRLLRQQEKPYDVFLCYKETDDHGGRTEDSLEMQKIYNDLSKEGYRVFFARETLKEKAGADYEAAIFAAIESSSVMLVMGTKKEYFESTWVRSEWRRFLEKEDSGDDKVLLPLFRDEKDFPKEFIYRSIQGYKMEGPYLLDVKSRLVKLLKAEDKRFSLAKVFLQVGEFKKADEKLDEMLQDAPTNAQIWLYKAMAAEEIKEEADFLKVRRRLDENSSFMAAMKFSAEAGKEKLREYLEASEKNARESEKQAAEKRSEESPSSERKEAFAPAPRADKEWVRGLIALEDGEYDRAAQVFDQMTKDDPTNAQGWLGKLMTEKKVCREEDLAQSAQPFAGNRNYERALRFGDEALRARLTGYENAVSQRLTEQEKAVREAAAREEAAREKAAREAAAREKAAREAAAQKMEDALKKAEAFDQKKDDMHALEQYRIAAALGSAEAQHMVGRYYEEGRGTRKNVTEAVKWYRKAAEQGHAGAQCRLGWSYYAGQGVKKSDILAAKWYRMAAEQGNAEGQERLGDCYACGSGVEKNDAEAVKWFRKAAEQGYAAAQYRLGGSYCAGYGVEKNEAEGVKWYRKAAEQGHAAAQCCLGGSYSTGVGVEKNDVEAVKWYRKAAEQGFGVAQLGLGECYQVGRGVEQNIDVAEQWYQKAKENGFSYPDRLRELERMKAERRAAAAAAAAKAKPEQMKDALQKAKAFYEKKDYVQALEQYRIAADLGSADAQYMTGRCYAEGLGVEKNGVEAVKWFQKAAAQRHADAQYELGNSYQNGIGLEKDPAMAVKWYRKAAEQGQENARLALETPHFQTAEGVSSPNRIQETEKTKEEQRAAAAGEAEENKSRRRTESDAVRELKAWKKEKRWGWLRRG